jgi:hypothetical protein
MSKDKTDELRSLRGCVSTCMLNNSYVTTVGVLIGTVIGVRRKSFQPLMYAGFAGALGDL